MARRSSLDRKSLIALGAERLADLMLEVGASDPAIKRQIKLAVASGADSGDAAALVRQRLATIRRQRTFLDWPKIKQLAQELSRQSAAICGPIAQRDPAMALTLLWEFLDLGSSLFSRCDDSNGLLGDTFRDACSQLKHLAAAAQPDPIDLAEQVFTVFCHNGYGLYDGVIGTLADALGPTGLAALKQRFEALAQQPVPVPPREEWRAVMWGSGGTRYVHELEEQSRLWAVQDGLKAVTQAQGDLDGFIAQFTDKQRRVPRIAAGIALRLLQANRPEEALRVLDDATPNPESWLVLDWEEARIAVLQALGQTDEAQKARWHCFEQMLQPSYLQDFLKHLPAFEDVEAEQRAIELAARHENVHQGLAFLLSWPSALGRAARLIEAQHAELDGHFYELFSSAAEQLSADYPLAATLALRCMVDFTLKEGRSSRYGHAADHLHSCQLLSSRINDWGTITPHANYIGAIRTTHARKSAFWSKAEALGL